MLTVNTPDNSVDNIIIMIAAIVRLLIRFIWRPTFTFFECKKELQHRSIMNTHKNQHKCD